MNKAKLRAFFLHQLTFQERKEVLEWLTDPSNDLQIRYWLKEDWEIISSLDIKDQLSTEEENQLWFLIQKHIKQSETAMLSGQDTAIEFISKKWWRNWKWAVAAACLMVMTSLAIVWLNSGVQQQENKQAEVTAPIDNRAILTLADGKQVPLDEKGIGLIAKQANGQVVKNEENEIVYKELKQSTLQEDAVQYNTLSLPRRSKPMKLILADGSVAWLNAESSITFPTRFVGPQRNVKINGEVYFEVAHDVSKPFLVSGRDFTVRVLGTHFNVRNYLDEKQSNITLLQGSVAVYTAGEKQLLRPAQQLSIQTNDNVLYKNVNVAEVMAWKNGEFYFDGEPLQTIMKEVERYYDVHVVFEDDIPFRFVTRISRDVKLSELLFTLSLTKLAKFEIKDKTVVIRRFE